MQDKYVSRLIVNFIQHPMLHWRRPLIMLLDVLLLPLSLWMACMLQFGVWVPDRLLQVSWALPAVLVLAVPVFVRFGLYRAVMIYIGSRAFFSIVVAVTLHTATVVLLMSVFAPQALPLTTFGIYWLVTLTLVGGSRMIIRGILLWLGKSSHHARNVIIYGAGDAGGQLVEALQVGVHYRPMALVDDNPELQGTEIQGLRIHDPRELPLLVKKSGVGEILLAMPSVSMERRRQIMDYLQQLKVRVRTVPALEDIVAGRARIDSLREIDIRDILGRPPVPPDEQLLTQCVTGKSVLVTGGGGSIGAELCRQILALAPKRLILYELSEYNLYTIEAELRNQLAGWSDDMVRPEIIPLLGNVTNEKKMELVLRTFKVHTVYHAAAYKHVPLVEFNPIEGVVNNVFGTWYAARAAARARVETFVLISTDKAVRPTNIMGATKRLAELVLQSLFHESQGSTRFCMVRFGNVLDSSGSVVPLFRQQIRSGGPITLTHPKMTRYFMTIPESAQLVIQAGAMCKGADVFVLDMGQPIAIQQLATRMIALSGLSIKDEEHPQGDIRIETTKIRPGEKLYEELLIGDNITPTQHPRILRACEHELSAEEIDATLAELRTACDRFDSDGARRILMAAIREYEPQCGIEDKVWLSSRDTATATVAATMIN